MSHTIRSGILYISLSTAISTLFLGCGTLPSTSNTNDVNVNTNANTANSNTNSNTNTNTTGGNGLTFVEPNAYQGVIKLTLETVGQQPGQKASMPPLSAVVARSGADRAMEFVLPTNEKVIYLENSSGKFIVLPSRKQFAELTSEALGFEVRRLMMPEQIMQQLKAIPGVKPAGEETVNGRQIMKYVYGNAAETGTQAGTVETESYFLIDKETGLPVRSEIVSQSASGASVQGVKGIRLVTEMSDIKETPDPQIFKVPAEFEKIDQEKVKAQANLLFSAAAALIGQLIDQANATPTPTASATAQ
ncbi:MAG: hypothetical protein AB7V18_04445 [Pyrinomonadaceae bacterium]